MEWLDTNDLFKYINDLGIKKYTWTSNGFVFKCNKCNEEIELPFNTNYIKGDMISCNGTCQLGKIIKDDDGKLLKKKYNKYGDYSVGYSNKGYWIFKNNRSNFSSELSNVYKLECNLSALELDLIVNHTNVNKHLEKHSRQNQHRGGSYRKSDNKSKKSRNLYY